MDTDTAKQPTIIIDLKKNRITITRITLQAIGNPEYILLLVNPEDRTLLILPSDSSDKRAHRIPSSSEKQRQIEFYSKSLLKSILSISHGWRDNFSYKVEGDVIHAENIMRFSVGISEPMS